MVNLVNMENASGGKKFSIREITAGGLGPLKISYGRGLKDPMPSRPPKFPYKPPANSPPRRKSPTKTEAPKLFPESEVAQPIRRL